MCHKSCIDFGKRALKEEYVKGKSVIEVGSMDINGSLRPIVEAFNPTEYIGVDTQIGAGVDQICNAENLIGKFGRNRFDMVICTEALEHVHNWKKVFYNLKQIIKSDGILLITTRSMGFRYHGYPDDFWRYDISDMEYIFADFDIKILEKDRELAGIFLLAKRPEIFIENRIFNHNLYSMILEKRSSIIRASINWKILHILLRFLVLLKLCQGGGLNIIIFNGLYIITIALGVLCESWGKN